jgi:hypothetical protein
MLSDKDLFVRCNSITNQKYFDRTLRSTVEFIVDHTDKYGDLPTTKQIKATTNIDIEDIDNIKDEHKDWFLDEYEKFCRYKALELAILASTDKLERKEYGAVEYLIKEAVSIGLAKEIGMNYWEDPEVRLEDIQNNKPAISTGWKAIDTVLYGGFERGTLNIFAAPSGHGKSLFLQNISINWALAGYNVVYISLELSEKLCSMRFDSMLTGYGTRDLFKNKQDVALKLGMTSKKAGQLQIVQLPNGITVNDLKAYIKEYQIQTGINVDAVVVDYLDLMTPARQKVQLSDVSLKDKLVSEELRNFAIDGNYLFATASQINRQGLDESEYGMGTIAGGLTKIYTADNAIGIHASRAMKERGIIQIEFMKTRSSGGEGKKIELGYDTICMRISDLPDDHNPQNEQPSVYDKVKSRLKSDNINNTATEQKVDTDRLKSILKRTE